MINSKFKIDVRYGIEYPETGKIEWKSEFEQNLINNGGMDMLATYWATQCTENVYLESGGSANSRSTGAITLTQTSTLVTSSAPIFIEDDGLYNRLIVWDDGTQAIITAFIDNSNVEVASTAIISANPASIYNVEETHMQGFVKASTTYKTDAGLNKNTWTEDSGILTITNKRTVEFPAEASNVTYSAAGWTPITGDNNAIFGRKVFDIAVLAGTKPIIQVIMTRVIDCTAIAQTTSPITGLSETGSSMNMMGSTDYNTTAYWSSINTSTGATVAPTSTTTFLECKESENLKVAIGEFSTALALGDVDITGSSYSAKTFNPTYTQGNFYMDYTASFNDSDLSSTDWNTIALLSDDADDEAFWRFLFDTPQNFENKILSNLTIRKTWKRSY